MKVSMVELPEICIIGKEGLCTREKNVVSELWEQANAHFHEVADLGMKEADGSYVGFWGAMSDEQMNFLPWEDDFTRGRYLAGVEVVREMEAPEGWTKWTMPARTYLVAEVAPERYQEIFREIIQKVIPERGMHLCGAVCDFTEPATGTGKLFFPVKADKKILADGEGRRMKVRLVPLEPDDRERFISDNQEAFRYGAMEEFGLRDDHFEEDGEIIARDTIERSIDSGRAYRILADGEVAGGLVLRVEGDRGDLDLLFVSPKIHSKGIGYAAWCCVEELYPEVRVWETCTPYFEKRNIHFYVNRCGFHIVEFFNEKHPDPHDPDGGKGDDFDGMFRFEKVMDRQQAGTN